jgi:hypothetical protein
VVTDLAGGDFELEQFEELFGGDTAGDPFSIPLHTFQNVEKVESLTFQG